MQQTSFSVGVLRPLILPMLAMGLTVLAANILVEYHFQGHLFGIDLANWLTWGTVTYPIAFLITDTTNRLFGAVAARRVVYCGFLIGVVLSLSFANMRIALASGSAFLLAQMLDIFIFDRLRSQSWWKAPFFSSLVGSAVDTALFFSIAFYGTPVPWVSLAQGDFIVKILMASLLLPIFRGLMALWPKPGALA